MNNVLFFLISIFGQFYFGAPPPDPQVYEEYEEDYYPREGQGVRFYFCPNCRQPFGIYNEYHHPLRRPQHRRYYYSHPRDRYYYYRRYSRDRYYYRALPRRRDQRENKSRYQHHQERRQRSKSPPHSGAIYPILPCPNCSPAHHNKEQT